MGRHPKNFNTSVDPFIGTVRESLRYGPYKILDMVASYRYVIQFIYSGCIRVTEKRRIIENKILDQWHAINPKIIHYSNNYGPFIILKIINNDAHSKTDLFHIKFLETGTEKLVKPDAIIRGTILDENAIRTQILDITLIQPNFIKPRLNKYKNAIYNSMIRRCTIESSDKYKNYGKIGITIDPYWLESSDNFYNDMPLIENYNKWERFPNLYQLDKDYKQFYKPKNERIYSRASCIFLHRYDNINLRTIENHNPNKYFGVYKITDNRYEVCFNVDDIKYHFGYFDNEIFAAAVYNYFYEKIHPYELVPVLNQNIPNFPIQEIVSKSNPIQLYNLVESKGVNTLEELDEYICNQETFSKYYNIKQEINNRSFEYNQYSTWSNIDISKYY